MNKSNYQITGFHIMDGIKKVRLPDRMGWWHHKLTQSQFIVTDELLCTGQSIKMESGDMEARRTNGR